MHDGSGVNPTPLRCRVMAGGAKTLALFALLALSLSTTYAASSGAFSDADLLGTLALAAAVNGVALLVLIGLPTPVGNALLSIVATFGVAGAHALHTDLFVAYPLLVWCLLGAAGFALFVAFGAMDRHPSVGLVLAALGSVTTGMFAADVFLARDEPSVVAAVDMSNFREVTFERRPNLYFVSFDAMAPRSLLRKYMDVETTPFHDVFEARFRPFENFFVNAIGTWHSLQSMLALDERWYARANRAARARSDSAYFKGIRLYAGRAASPLFRLLKDNGYETTTMHDTTFWGKAKGPFVDHYLLAGAPALCGSLDERVRAVSFWGYCALVGQRHGRYETYRQMIDQLALVSDKPGKRPQFAMAHLYTPGHASVSFRYDDEDDYRKFRERYLLGSVDAAYFLARLLHHLDKVDPEGILLVYGDHGALLSRNVAFADAPEFVVQDHFGVLGGVYPPDACARWFDAAQERRGYLTLLDAVHTVIRCLSGGESALRVTPKEHSMVGDWQGVVPDGHLQPYSEFLYE